MSDIKYVESYVNYVGYILSILILYYKICGNLPDNMATISYPIPILRIVIYAVGSFHIKWTNF
jgi:hypothetical protein